MKELKLLSLLPVILFPFTYQVMPTQHVLIAGFLPAVNNKSGEYILRDAHRRVRKLCTATEVGFNGMVYCCSPETFQRLSGGLWGGSLPKTM